MTTVTIGEAKRFTGVERPVANLTLRGLDSRAEIISRRLRSPEKPRASRPVLIVGSAAFA